ncbi:hypothetical protein OHB49_39955 [Streptomyces sp. NBC_01717]|uniref:hypothetical protein n=1 Tax=Streptomyces sp. NBC_01717 TaxID=2975918 RepID=UPI002E319D9D|nr:hypothetical protein [Streptomyces sp. NBC_01717]
MDVERHGMAVRVFKVPDLVTGLEGERQMAARAQRRWNSANTSGNSSDGVWMMEYQAMMQPRLPSVVVADRNCIARAPGRLHPLLMNSITVLLSPTSTAARPVRGQQQPGPPRRPVSLHA